MAQDEQAGMLESIMQNAPLSEPIQQAARRGIERAFLQIGLAPEVIAEWKGRQPDQPEPQAEPTEPAEQVAQIEAKKDGFQITDKSGLEWYVRRIAAIRSERETIKAQADKMIAALNADEAILRGLYQAEAQQVTAHILADGGNKRKSVETFFGTFGFRTVSGSYSVTDTDAALFSSPVPCRCLGKNGSRGHLKIVITPTWYLPWLPLLANNRSGDYRCAGIFRNNRIIAQRSEKRSPFIRQ